MKRVLLVGCAVLGVGLAPPAYAASIVVNGGFEQLDSGPGPDFASLTSIPSWSTKRLPSPAGAGFEMQFGSRAGTPQGGDQLLELDGFFRSNIFQYLPSAAGAYYLVEWFSPRPGMPAIGSHIDFLWNGATLITLLADGPGLTSTLWTPYSFLRLTTGSSAQFEFRDLRPDDHDSSGAIGGYLASALLVLAGGLLARAGRVRHHGYVRHRIL